MALKSPAIRGTHKLVPAWSAVPQTSWASQVTYSSTGTFGIGALKPKKEMSISSVGQISRSGLEWQLCASCT